MLGFLTTVRRTVLPYFRHPKNTPRVVRTLYVATIDNIKLYAVTHLTKRGLSYNKLVKVELTKDPPVLTPR
jgi:hypothetical protein